MVHVEGRSGRVRGEGTAASWPAVRNLLLRGAASDGSVRAKAAADARRERDADRHLLAAGISPGDPSLYQRADGTVVPRGRGGLVMILAFGLTIAAAAALRSSWSP